MASVTIRRANVILQIPDDEATVSRYLAQGYDVVQDGKVVRASTHGKSESELRTELERLQGEIVALKKENKDLRGKLDALVAGMEDTEEESTPVKEEAPKKKRSTKAKN